MTVEQVDKARRLFVEELRTLKPEAFAMRRIFDAVPFIFDSSRACSEWKIGVAGMLGVDPCSVFVIGSGCTGISLNPNKGFKAFDADSDIDVAVVSGFHFEVGWRALRDIRTKKYNLDAAALASLSQHRESYLYWGMIATDKILNVLPFGNDWIKATLEFAKRSPIEGRAIKFRLYRDSYSLVSYHLNNLINLQSKLLTKD